MWCMVRAKKRAKGKQPKTPLGKSERVSVSFTPEQHQFLSHMADRKQVSIAWVIRAAVDKLVSEETPLFKGSPL
jgi:ParG